jgi:hypothetical protein
MAQAEDAAAFRLRAIDSAAERNALLIGAKTA